MALDITLRDPGSNFNIILALPTFVLSLSSNFADGDPTTAQLTPPSGKTTGDFQAGKMSESSNPMAGIDLDADKYTELEWCIQATDYAEEGPIIVGSYSESKQNSAYIVGLAYTKVGQSFIPSSPGILESCKWYLKRYDSPTGNAYAKIYAHSGTYGENSIPTGPPLAVSDPFDVSTLTDSYQLITFNFSGANKIVLTENTPYVITFEYVDSGGYVYCGDDTSSPNHSGNGSFYASESWTPTSADFCFYVYSEIVYEFRVTDNGTPIDTYTKTPEWTTEIGVETKTKTITAKARIKRTLYWVGGTGNWSDDDNHWSTSSGGSPADGNLPTAIDDIVIDSNSGFGGGGTISLDTTAVCNDFTSISGHSYTIEYVSSDISIYGSATFESGLTFDSVSQLYIYFLATSSGKTITANGASIYYVLFEGSGGEWTLQDDITISGGFYHNNGTFDANNHNITAGFFSWDASTGYTPAVNMGSGTWEATKWRYISFTYYAWDVDERNGVTVDFTPGTSTIKISHSGPENKVFACFTDGGQGGQTFNNVWFTGTGTGSLSFGGSNTFNDFKVDNPPHTIKFYQGTTTTVTTFTVSGTAGNLITIDSVNGLTQHTLSKASGTVNCDYLDISNSNATGGATWYAGANSIDSGNNSGWIFIKTKTIQAKARIKKQVTKTSTSRAWILGLMNYPNNYWSGIVYWYYNFNDPSRGSAFRFKALETTEVTTISLRIYAVSDSPVLRVGIKANSGTPWNLPTGDFLTSATFTPTATGWLHITVPAYTLTKGLDYHVVVLYESGTIDSTHYGAICHYLVEIDTRYPFNLEEGNLETRSSPDGGVFWTIESLGTPIFLINKAFGQPYHGQVSGRLYSDRVRGQYVKFKTSRVINTLSFYIKKGGSPPNNLTYEIRDEATNSILRSGLIATPSEVTDTYTHKKILLSSPLTLDAGAGYRFVARTTGGDTNNYFDVGGSMPDDNADIYRASYGASLFGMAYSNDGGANWGLYPQYDTYFDVSNEAQITAKGSIQKTFEKTIETKGRINIVNTKTIDSKALIKKVFTQTVTAKARLKWGIDYAALEGYCFTETSAHGAIVRETNGRLWVTAVKWDGSYWQVYVAYSDDEGVSWTEEQITYANDTQYTPKLALDGNNTLHLIWEGTDWGAYPSKKQILYANKPKGGSWSSPIVLDEMDYDQDLPTIAVDSKNNLHVTWGGYGWGDYPDKFKILYKKRLSNGTWDSTEIVNDIDYDQSAPQIAVDSQDDLHIVWRAKGYGYNPPTFSIVYKKKTGEAWGDVELVGECFNRYAPCIAIDSNDKPHVVYGSPTGPGNWHQVIYKNKVGESWSSQDILDSYYQLSCDASIAVDQDDNVHVVYHYNPSAATQIRRIAYIKRTGESWGSKKDIYVTSGDLYDAKQPVILWALHPHNASYKPSVTKSGILIVLNDYEVGYVIRILKSPDLVLETEYNVIQATISAKANITLGIEEKTQTLSAKARITITTIQTINAKAQISQVSSQTISALARIEKERTQTLTSKGRITTTSEKIITAKGRITLTSTQNVVVKANIKTKQTKTISAKGRVQKEFTQVISAKASLKKEISQIISAKARIKVAVEQTIITKASIRKQSNQTIQAKSRIQISSGQNLTAKARIEITTIKSITAKGRIGLAGIGQTIDAKASIKKTITRTILAKARIQRTFTQSIEAKGRITFTSSQTINTKGRIEKQSSQTIQALGRIQISTTQNIQAKARVQISNEQSIQAKAAIKIATTQSITAKARIQRIEVQTITAKANIKAQQVQIVQAKASIRSFQIKTINAKGDIKRKQWTVYGDDFESYALGVGVPIGWSEEKHYLAPNEWEIITFQGTQVLKIERDDGSQGWYHLVKNDFLVQDTEPYIVQTDILIDEGYNYCGLVFGWKKEDWKFRFCYDYQYEYFRLEEEKEGAFTVNFGEPITPWSYDTWYQLKVTVSSNQIKGYYRQRGEVDWIEVCSITPKYISIRGQVGFETSGWGPPTVLFDNLIVGRYLLQAKASIFKAGVIQLISAKANIAKEIIQTIQAKARIGFLGSVQTIEAKANIKKIGLQTVITKASIKKQAIQTLTTKGRIQIVSQQTINAKGRIVRTYIQTIVAKGRIQKAFSQTIEAKADIKKLSTQTIQVKASIKKSITQTVQARGRIALISTQTISALGRIQKSTEQTISAKGRIQILGIQEIEAKADIKKTQTQSITAKSRIINTYSQTIQALGRIQKQFSQTLMALGRITVFTTREISAKAAIQRGFTQTVDAKARITITPSQTITAKADIKKSTDRTIQAKGRIGLIGTSQTIEAKADIKTTSIKTITAKGVIKKTFEKTISAKARIQITSTKSLISKANIKKTQEQTVNAKGRVVATYSQTISALGKIEKQTTRTISAQGRISIVSQQSIQAKSAIKKTIERTISALAQIGTFFRRTIQAKARIQKTTKRALEAKGRVQIHTTQSIDVKARLGRIEQATIDAKGRITISSPQTIEAKGCVSVTTSKTVNVKGRIGRIETQTISAKARIEVISAQTISVKGNIQKSQTQTFFAKGSIKKTGQQEINAKARIGLVSEKIISAKARITITTEQTISARADIVKLIITQTITAKGRIATPAISQTIQAKANILQSVSRTISAKGSICTYRVVEIIDQLRDQRLVQELTYVKEITREISYNKVEVISIVDERTEIKDIADDRVKVVDITEPSRRQVIKWITAKARIIH